MPLVIGSASESRVRAPLALSVMTLKSVGSTCSAILLLPVD